MSALRGFKRGGRSWVLGLTPQAGQIPPCGRGRRDAGSQGTAPPYNPPVLPRPSSNSRSLSAWASSWARRRWRRAGWCGGCGRRAAPLPSPHPALSRPLPPSLTGRGEKDSAATVVVGAALCGRPVPKAATRPGRPHRAAPTRTSRGRSPSSPGVGGREGSGEEGRGDEASEGRPPRGHRRLWTRGPIWNTIPLAVVSRSVPGSLGREVGTPLIQVR